MSRVEYRAFGQYFVYLKEILSNEGNNKCSTLKFKILGLK